MPLPTARYTTARSQRSGRPGAVRHGWFNLLIEPPDLEIALESLRAELAAANAELKAHMASWEYAFAMGSGREGARQHPKHLETHARTDHLTGRCRDLRARLAEYEL